MKRVVLLEFVIISLALFNLVHSTHLTNEDRIRLKSLFSQTPTDLSTAHYNALGLKLLDTTVPQALCSFINQKVDTASLESLYHATSAAALINGCGVKFSPPSLDSGFKDGAPLVDLYYATMIQNNVGQTVDSVKVSKLLQAALKKDDTVVGLGLGFQIASLLTGDLKSFAERIEDAIVQSDEVDGQYLQFEGGISNTANVLIGACALGQAAKLKSLPLPPDQVLKFANYLLSRKHVQSPKGAALLLKVLHILVKNPFHIPLSITLGAPSALSTPSSTFAVRVTNLLGAPVAPLKLELESATRVADKKVVLSKKELTPSVKDNSLHTLNFLETKPVRGFYTLAVKATSPKADTLYIGTTTELNIKVLTEVVLSHIEIGVEDRDQTIPIKTARVDFNKQLSTPLEADFHQRVILKFALQDKLTGGPLPAHQVFVALTNAKTQQEIVFVAESDPSHTYKFDLDVHLKAKDFGYQSGSYHISLIVGDPIISNPFTWKVGSLSLTFPSQQQSASKQNLYQPKPEIKHLFRPQEKRPAAVVSTTFSVLVILPWLTLILLWFKLGVNISNFPCSLGAIGFHSGLGAIFALFGYFWIGLDMFTTLKYLSVLGVLTFLSGHRLLSKLANKK